ncbi:MAG: hypothetical protein HWD61_13405 [Parachlamydiaceae bacterium]|nr:MAG: hypothetical protein HWD61_13405 [Parachlamydiaceae bacterium]
MRKKKQLKENIDELKHQLEAVTVKGKRLSRRMQSLPSSENLAALESRKSLNESLGEEEILSIQDNKKTFANKKQIKRKN